MHRVWVVEDEDSLRKAEEKYLNRQGYLVSTFADGESMLAKLEDEQPQVVFLDLKLPGISGEELLPKIKEKYRETRVIIVSAYSEVENVVKVIRKGAFDFIKKPFNIEEFGHTLKKALENLTLTDEISYLKSREAPVFLSCPSPAMRRIEELVEKIASTPGNTTVLINGESGAGKEVIARMIYEAARSTGKFVELNCSSIPEPLLESELFGHTRGAFTDAYQEKKGLFELADNGTLFLDEIGDMPPKLQAKLLKVLETKEIKLIGGLTPIQVNVRIVAATNKNLEKEVETGNFRADLFYRLNVFPIIVPALRDRREDILPLSQYFITRFNREFRKKISGLSSSAREDFLSYSWPGNVRELKNVIERAMIMESGDELTPVSMARKTAPGQTVEISGEGIDLEATLASIEKQYIQKALEAAGWNQSRAAQFLKIPREILRYRMKKYELT